MEYEVRYILSLNSSCTTLKLCNAILIHSLSYSCVQMSDDPESVATRPPIRTAPRIGCLIGDEPQYFLFVENKILFHVSTLSRALTFWFVLLYIFNLEYCPHVKSVALFFQEFVFKLPATSKKCYIPYHYHWLSEICKVKYMFWTLCIRHYYLSCLIKCFCVII